MSGASEGGAGSAETERVYYGDIGSWLLEGAQCDFSVWSSFGPVAGKEGRRFCGRYGKKGYGNGTQQADAFTRLAVEE